MNILDRIVQSKRREVDALRAARYYQANYTRRAPKNREKFVTQTPAF